MSSPKLSKLHKDVDRYYSDGYLNCWCSSVKEEWSLFLAGIFTSSDLFSKSADCKILDVGCGPSIANIISASRISSNITMADYLTSNRNEVERFKTNADDAFQWQHYFHFLSSLEPDITTVDDIMQRTRNAIKRILFCDVTRGDMFDGGNDEEETLPNKEAFDVIIASLVFDVVALNKAMFKEALCNVLSYLKPNGLILIHGSLGEHRYTVGSASFPAMTADESMLLEIFQECHLKLVKWETCEKLTTHYYTALRK